MARTVRLSKGVFQVESESEARAERVEGGKMCNESMNRSRTRASAQRKARGRSVALPLLLPSDHTSAPRARHASLDEMPLNFARPLDQGMLLTTTTSDAVGEAAGANASSNLPSSPTARPPADPPALGFHSLNFESGRTSPPGNFGTSDSSANDQLDFATSYSLLLRSIHVSRGPRHVCSCRVHEGRAKH